MTDKDGLINLRLGERTYEGPADEDKACDIAQADYTHRKKVRDFVSEYSMEDVSDRYRGKPTRVDIATMDEISDERKHTLMAQGNRFGARAFPHMLKMVSGSRIAFTHNEDEPYEAMPISIIDGHTRIDPRNHRLGKNKFWAKLCRTHELFTYFMFYVPAWITAVVFRRDFKKEYLDLW